MFAARRPGSSVKHFVVLTPEVKTAGTTVPINCNLWTQLTESHLGSELALRGQKQVVELRVYLDLSVWFQFCVQLWESTFLLQLLSETDCRM